MFMFGGQVRNIWGNGNTKITRQPVVLTPKPIACVAGICKEGGSIPLIIPHHQVFTIENGTKFHPPRNIMTKSFVQTNALVAWREIFEKIDNPYGKGPSPLNHLGTMCQNPTQSLQLFFGGSFFPLKNCNSACILAILSGV